MSRYGLSGLVNNLVGPTLLGTFVVNISGAFALGLLIALTEERFVLPAAYRPVLAIGFLGAYTTFSTLLFESVDRLEAGELLSAGVNLAGSVGAGLLATYAGLSLGRLL